MTPKTAIASWCTYGDTAPLLYRAIYVSRCTIPADPKTFSTSIKSILNWSREWNISNYTTGVLYCNSEHFAQVLEGPRGIIQSTLGHIMCDDRNHNPELLEFSSIDRRDFEGWAMAYIDGTGGPDIHLSKMTRPPITRQSDGILALLRWLVNSPRSSA